MSHNSNNNLHGPDVVAPTASNHPFFSSETLQHIIPQHIPQNKVDELERFSDTTDYASDQHGYSQTCPIQQTYFISMWGIPAHLVAFITAGSYQNNPRNNLFGPFITTPLFKPLCPRQTNQQLLNSYTLPLPSLLKKDPIQLGEDSDETDNEREVSELSKGNGKPSPNIIQSLFHASLIDFDPSQHFICTPCLVPGPNGKVIRSNGKLPASVPFLKLSLPGVEMAGKITLWRTMNQTDFSNNLDVVAMQPDYFRCVANLHPFHGVGNRYPPFLPTYDSSIPYTGKGSNGIQSDFQIFNQFDYPDPTVAGVGAINGYRFHQLKSETAIHHLSTHHVGTVLLLDLGSIHSRVILGDFITQSIQILAKGCVYQLTNVPACVVAMNSQISTQLTLDEINSALTQLGFTEIHVFQLDPPPDLVLVTPQPNPFELIIDTSSTAPVEGWSPPPKSLLSHADMDTVIKPLWDSIWKKHWIINRQGQLNTGIPIIHQLLDSTTLVQDSYQFPVSALELPIMSSLSKMTCKYGQDDTVTLRAALLLTSYHQWLHRVKAHILLQPFWKARNHPSDIHRQPFGPEAWDNFKSYFPFPFRHLAEPAPVRFQQFNHFTSNKGKHLPLDYLPALSRPPDETILQTNEDGSTSFILVQNKLRTAGKPQLPAVLPLGELPTNYEFESFVLWDEDVLISDPSIASTSTAFIHILPHLPRYKELRLRISQPVQLYLALKSPWVVHPLEPLTNPKAIARRDEFFTQLTNTVLDQIVLKNFGPYPAKRYDATPDPKYKDYNTKSTDAGTTPEPLSSEYLPVDHTIPPFLLLSSEKINDGITAPTNSYTTTPLTFCHTRVSYSYPNSPQPKDKKQTAETITITSIIPEESQSSTPISQITPVDTTVQINNTITHFGLGLHFTLPGLGRNEGIHRQYCQHPLALTLPLVPLSWLFGVIVLPFVYTKTSVDQAFFGRPNDCDGGDDQNDPTSFRTHLPQPQISTPLDDNEILYRSEPYPVGFVPPPIPAFHQTVRYGRDIITSQPPKSFNKLVPIPTGVGRRAKLDQQKKPQTKSKQTDEIQYLSETNLYRDGIPERPQWNKFNSVANLAKANCPVTFIVMIANPVIDDPTPVYYDAVSGRYGDSNKVESATTSSTPTVVPILTTMPPLATTTPASQILTQFDLSATSSLIEPITKSQYRYFSQHIPALYKEQLIHQQILFPNCQNSGTKLEHFWNVEVCQASDDFKTIYKRLETEAVSRRLELYLESATYWKNDPKLATKNS